jgi:hypothetical protein
VGLINYHRLGNNLLNRKLVHGDFPSACPHSSPQLRIFNQALKRVCQLNGTEYTNAIPSGAEQIPE